MRRAKSDNIHSNHRGSITGSHGDESGASFTEYLDPTVTKSDRIECALCEKDTKLCKSQIIPEFCYKLLYGNKRGAIFLDRRRPAGKIDYLQKGMREKLLCSNCECYLNKYFENPFLTEWVKGNHIPNPMSQDVYFHKVSNYTTFKLFHLSVLWRASVAIGETWKNIIIPDFHREQLRSMIISGDAGKSDSYGIICYVSVTHQNRPIASLISQPTNYFVEGLPAFQFIYAGATWYYLCSDGCFPKTYPLLLKEDGTIPLLRDNIFLNRQVTDIARAHFGN